MMLVQFTYLITKDIVETLERKFEIKVKDTEGVKTLENEFLEKFWQYVPNNIRKCAIDASDVKPSCDTQNLVSLDRVYFPDAKKYLEVTRITDSRTGDVRISERPGTEPLAEQINRISSKKILLADVGAFNGTTLLSVCGLLEAQGKTIESILLCFSSRYANERINSTRKLEVLNLFEFYEWVELRDLFGIDGRNVGLIDNVRQFIPYWENLTGWASISKQYEKDVSRMCKEYNQKLLQILKKEKLDISRIGKAVEYKGGK